jgi:hypothetical protein
VGQLSELVYKIDVKGRLVNLHVNRLKKCRDSQFASKHGSNANDQAKDKKVKSDMGTTVISDGVIVGDTIESDGVIPGEVDWIDGPILVEDNFVDDVVHEVEPVDFDSTVSTVEPEDPRDTDWEPELPAREQEIDQNVDGPAYRTRSRVRIQ